MATRCPLCRRSFSANDVLDFDNLQRRHATLANPRASPGETAGSAPAWGPLHFGLFAPQMRRCSYIRSYLIRQNVKWAIWTIKENGDTKTELR